MRTKTTKVLLREELGNSIVVVVGTRPGIIKFAPVIRELQQRRINFYILHTGQHYSYNMDKKFFEDLQLPEPAFKNEVVRKETLHGAQTAEMLKGLEKALLELKPRLVIVGGDANTNLAGALAARKLGIEVAHMEAGLRSGDWRMPEEHNRVMIDHISEYLFTPTEETRLNLVKDNVKGKIYVVGNTIVDAVYQNIEISKEQSEILKKLDIEKEQYFLLTIHREENVDHDEALKNILKGIFAIAEDFKTPVIFPVHPRTQKRFSDLSLEDKVTANNYIRIINPVGYLDFLMLLSCARLVLTDSGGIQEESCILRVPCVTLRDNTERPETIEVGSNVLAGTDPKKILKSVEKMLTVNRTWINPFGDGKAAARIVDVIGKA